MQEFKIGDKVWVAGWGQIAKDVPCPACYTKREVTLILGNGDHIILPCEGCSQGYMPPTGYVTEYEFSSEPEIHIITGIETRQTEKGVDVEYRASQYCLPADRVFDNESDARAEGEKMAAEQHEKERTRAEYIKHDKNKKYSWNAVYHLREAKRKRKEADGHEEKAKLCKERATEVTNG